MQQSTSVHLRPPLDRVYLTEVHARVVFKLVEVAYRRDPQPFTVHAPSEVLRLGQHYREHGFGYLMGAFLSLSKSMQEGWTMAEWRQQFPIVRGPRALHKQRLLRGPKR